MRGPREFIWQNCSLNISLLSFSAPHLGLVLGSRRARTGSSWGDRMKSHVINTQIHLWSSFREIALLRGNLLSKITVEAPRGTLTTRICVWAKEKLPFVPIDATTRRLRGECIAPKNRTSEQMPCWSVYTRMSVVWPAMQILFANFIGLFSLMSLSLNWTLRCFHSYLSIIKYNIFKSSFTCH